MYFERSFLVDDTSFSYVIYTYDIKDTYDMYIHIFLYTYNQIQLIITNLFLICLSVTKSVTGTASSCRVKGKTG